MTTSVQYLSQLAAVVFRGRDAAPFLQGQLTINTQTLLPGQWRRAAYCSRQGRMLACGMLAHLPAESDEEQCFLFLLSADLAEVVKTLLQRFILRAKVRIELPAAHVIATVAAAAPPATGSGVVTLTDGIATLDEGVGRQLQVNVADMSQADMQTRCAVSGGGGEDWHLGEIQRGVPWLCMALRDALIPQFVNFDVLGGVDFQKGCFVGQEVISRLHHLGEVKRRGMIVSGGGAAAAADTLTDVNGKPAGVIVSSVAVAEGFVAFAAVARAAGALLLDGRQVNVQLPPYPIVEQEKFKRR